MAARDREARAKAEELDARYKRSRYTAETSEAFAPKALLMPSVNDPSIWGVKCKVRPAFNPPRDPPFAD